MPHPNLPDGPGPFAAPLNARVARMLFAICAIMALLGAAALWLAGRAGMPHTEASVRLWGCFSLLAAGLCALPDRRITRLGLGLFLAAGIAALLVNALLRGQGVHTAGLVFAPLLVLSAALMLPPLQAAGLSLATIVGLFLLYRSPELGMPVGGGPDEFTHLAGLTLACVMALAIGLFSAMRFTQATRLSLLHEVRYRELFDRIPSAVVLHDSGRMLDANLAALQIIGQADRGAIAGLDLREFMVDDQTRRLFDRRMRELLESSEALTPELDDLTVRRRDGSAMHLRTTATVLRDVVVPDLVDLIHAPGTRPPAKRPLILSFMLDDTERVMAQAETIRARTMLEAALSHSPYAFVLSRRVEGTVAECNAAYETLVGRSREELMGSSSLALGIWPRPEDRERFIENLQRQPAGTEQRIWVVRGDGQWRLLNCCGSLLTLDGVEYLLMMGRDTTELQRREAEQQAVVEFAPIGLATTRGGITLSANPRMHEIFGLPPGRMVGMSTRQLWPDRSQHDRREQQVLADLRQHGWTRFDEEYALPGRRLHVRMQGRLLPLPGEGPPLIAWIVEDITQDLRAAQALREAVDLAERASQAKSAFLANMSHELRTPLNGLLGLLDLALQPGLDAQRQRHHLELARESGKLLGDLVTDVLDLSKIEAGRLEIEPAPFDLRALLHSLHAVHEVLAESRGLNLNFDLSALPAGAVWLEGDALRIRQILHNYLSNALKFTPSGGVVELRVRPAAAGAAPLRFEVQDSGPGIAPEVRPRLFSAFEQGDASTTRHQGGTGLGLAICRQLAALMQGEVGVESEPGRGACFWVELPLPAAPEPTLRPAVAQAAAPDLQGLRVLVAEDNPVNMLITTAMLERAGVRVQGVADGRLALQAVEQAEAQGDAFDLLLLDIQMPGMDGLQAAQALRRTHSSGRLPIIALTAGALQAEKDAALQAGMDDFITKPVDRDSLLECVRRHHCARAA